MPRTLRWAESFRIGFLSASAGAAAGWTGVYKATANSGVVGRTVTAGVIGGTASALGGGKFANGAWTSSFQHLLNAEGLDPIAEAMMARGTAFGSSASLKLNYSDAEIEAAALQGIITATDVATTVAGGVATKAVANLGFWGRIGRFFGAKAVPVAPRVRLNIFGEGEAKGFLDVATDAWYAEGRQLTSTLASGSADDIFIRFSPVRPETVSEIIRLSKSGTRITVLEVSGGGQGAILRQGLGDAATTTLQRTFESQTHVPRSTLDIIKMTVK